MGFNSGFKGLMQDKDGQRMLVLLRPVVLFTHNPAFLVWLCRVLSSSDVSKHSTVAILE